MIEQTGLSRAVSLGDIWGISLVTDKFEFFEYSNR